jgi:hypothetical protein
LRAPFYLIIFIQFVFLFIFSCGENIEDPDPPSAPEWAVSTPMLNLLKIGANPIHNDDGIQLIWRPNSEPDISGYFLYRQKDAADEEFEIIADVTAYGLSGIDTSMVDNTVSKDISYLYYLKAYDQAGNLSLPSDTIQYQPVEKVYLRSPLESISNGQPAFEWHDDNYSRNQEYLLRLEALDNQEVIWISRFHPPNYGDFFQRISYNNDGFAVTAALESGTSYRWCIETILSTDTTLLDTIQIDYSLGGSLSNWGYFSIN